MKRYAIKALAASVLASGVAHAQAQDNPTVTQAQSVASQWLALNDAGQYASAWTQAADVLKTKLSASDWVTAMAAVRAPLGNVQSRTLTSTQYTQTFPSTPGGDYVMLQFTSQFEHKANAVETVVPLKDKDGVWRVGGYFMK